MKRTLLLLFTCLATTLFAHAQSNEVTLVVSGEGPNKTEATALALRSAIEQAYGTFVSANTEILNDEIVRDEIATVASGNIKSYKEISSIQTTEGYYVTVQAVVSIGKLIEYSKSHGSSAEFAGQTFAMNIKMKKLNKENEAKALHNLILELRDISKNMFDLCIDVNGEPIKGGHHMDGYDYYLVNVTIKYKSNEAAKLFYETLYNTLTALCLSEQEIKDYSKTGEKYYSLEIKGLPSESWRENSGLPYDKKNDPKRRLYYSDYSIKVSLRNDLNMFRDELDRIFYNAIYTYTTLKLNGLDYRYSLTPNLERTSFEMEIFGTQIRTTASHSTTPAGLDVFKQTIKMIGSTDPHGFGRGRILKICCNRSDCDWMRDVSLYKWPVMEKETDRYGNRFYTIEGLRRFSFCGDNLFNLCFDIPIKEEDLMNLSGFSVFSDWPASSTSGKSTQNSLENKQSTQPATKTASQPVTGKDNEVYQIAENMPKFPGEDQKMWEFISHNIQYPQEALEKRIQGRVFVGFIVEPDGSLSDVKVLRSLGSGCDEEAMRVIKSMPKWEPGKQRGQAVRVSYQIPVDFRLQ